MSPHAGAACPAYDPAAHALAPAAAAAGHSAHAQALLVPV